MSDGFLDTNVIVYHLTHALESFGERCTAYLLGLAEGRRAADCSSTAIHEVTFVLERQFRVPRVDIASKHR